MKTFSSFFAAAMLAFLALASCQKEISFEVFPNPNIDTTGSGGGGNTGDLLVKSREMSFIDSVLTDATFFYDFDANKRLIRMKVSGIVNGITSYGFQEFTRNAEGLITYVRRNGGDTPDDSSFLKVFRHANNQVAYLLLYDRFDKVNPTDSFAVSYNGALLKEKARYSYELGTPDDPMPIWKEIPTWSNGTITKMVAFIDWDDATQKWGQQAQLNYTYDNKKPPYDLTIDDAICYPDLMEQGYSVNNLVYCTLQQQVGFPTLPYATFTLKYGANNRPSEQTLLFSPPGIEPGTFKTTYTYK